MNSKFHFNADQLVKACTALSATASTKENRPILTAINFRYTRDDYAEYMVLSATDSAILATIKLPILRCELADHQNFSIPAKELLNKAKLMHDKKAPYQEISIEVDGETATLTNEPGVDIARIETINGDYPITESLLNHWSLGKDDIKLAIGTALLDQISKAVKAHGKEGVTINIPKSAIVDNTHVLRPVYCTIPDYDLFIVATPMRVW